MKTITQIAKEAGVSRQTVYSTVKRAGISLDELNGQKQGNKTVYPDESVNTIRKLLRQSNDKQDKQKTDRIDNQTACQVLEIEKAKLEEALRNKEEIITILKADKERLEDANKQERQKVEQLFLKLADLNAEKKLLEAESKKGFWKKLFSKQNK